MRQLVFALVLLLAGTAAAQSVRSLGMGGVRLGLDAPNPALAAASGLEGNAEIPLPIGLLALATDARTNPTSGVFDPLTALDRALHPFTYIFAPATSPEVIRIGIETTADGPPVFTLELEGGSRIAVLEQPNARFAQRLELPLGGTFGAFSVAARPYAFADASLRGEDLSALLANGLSTVRLDVAGVAEAGVALDLAGAVPIALPGGKTNALWVGARLSPFLGLARLDAEGSITAGVDPDTNEITYTYEARAFESGLDGGGIGYGVGADLGVAGRVGVEGGTALVGVAVNDARVTVWEGTERAWSGTEASGTETPATPVTRTHVLQDVSVFVHGAFDADGAALDVPGLQGLLVAADLETDFASAEAHVGAEAALGLGPFGARVRGGLGYASGLVAGVGAGVDVAGIGLDVALHTFRSTLTLDSAFGVSAGLVLRF